MSIAVSDLLKSSSLDKAIKTRPVKQSAFQLTSPSKRPISILEDDHNSDVENVNPLPTQNAKRAKLDGGKPDFFKPSFNLSINKPVITTPSAPASKRKHDETSSFNITAPHSAPAERVIKPLKHKRVDLLADRRPGSYKRIDPPVRKSTGGALPFSIDAALSGTLGTSPPASKPTKRSKTQSKGQPKGWFFDIHEDTPEEEAAIVMEHSCGILDLSSDDESGPVLKKAKIGKENIAPADYVAAHVNADVAPRARARKADADVMADEGDRSPLSDLEPEEYFANGLDKDSVAVLPADEEGEETEREDEDDAHAEQFEGKPVDEPDAEVQDENRIPELPAFNFVAKPMPAPRRSPAAAEFAFKIAEDVDDA